ncbi:MAG: glycosyltransferase family 4 protein [Acidobacteriota bacterium]
MRILFVLENYWPNVGGVETLFRSAAEELGRRGHQVTVVTSRLRGTAVHERHAGVLVRRVRVPQFLRRYLFMVLALPAAVRVARGADVVHTTTYNAAVPGWLAGLLTRRPVVLTVHEVFAEQWQRMPGMNRWLGWGYRIYESLILRLPFRAFICDSDFTRGRLLTRIRTPRDRTVTIYPSHDASFWSVSRHAPRALRQEIGAGAEAFIYLYFGRPGVSKGVHDLIEAVPFVAAALKGSRLVMLLSREPADQYARVLRRVRELGISDSVSVLDSVPRDNLPGYLMAAGCVVVPSISEGFGYAALEAASLGCRVIATRGHSVEEILGDVVTLVPPRQPEALAAAIVSAAKAEFHEAKTAPRFPVEKHVEALLEVYAGMLQR